MTPQQDFDSTLKRFQKVSDFSGMAPGPMHTCDPCFSSYGIIARWNGVGLCGDATRDSRADGAQMTHPASDDAGCQGPFSFPAIGHPRHVSANPGVWGKAFAAVPCKHRACHVTFFHGKNPLKSAPRASFTNIRANFYPRDLEKTLFLMW